MSESKDYTPENDAMKESVADKIANPSVDQRPKESSANSVRSSSYSQTSSNRSRSSRHRSSSSSNSGSSKSKVRDRIKMVKRSFFLGIYAAMMLVSVSRMMDELLMSSFWLDLSAFGLLWIYYALSSQKIITLFRVSKSWFYAHLLVVLTHLAIALLLGDADLDASFSKPIHKDLETPAVVQPYNPTGE
jgi:hypothetical protein